MTVASAAGILAFLIGVPVVYGILVSCPQYRRLMLALMIFTICYVKKPFYQEVFFVNYRGVDRGFAVTLPDLFFFGYFLFILTGGLGRKIVWLPFNSIPWFLLITISCLSLVGSIEPFYGLFTVHKMIRCWIFYLVLVNTVRTRQDVLTVITAMAASVVFEAVVVFWDKYVTKAVVARSMGTFRHPNTLAMYTDLIIPILTATFLTPALPKRHRLLFPAAIVCGFIGVLFTKSRAAMMLVPLSLGTVVIVSLLLKPTARKVMIFAGGVVVVALIVLIALPKLIRRFETAPKESAETREYFNEAAREMANDHFFGVGINLYSHSLAKTDYYWYVYPDKVDVEDPEAFRESVQGQSRLGTAHHIYWLYAAETGYIGAAVFTLHITIFSIYTLILLFREKDPFFQAIYLGIMVGTTIHHLHGVLEWIFRQTEVLYLYFALMGLMVAMARIRKDEIAAERRMQLDAVRTRQVEASIAPKTVEPIGSAQYFNIGVTGIP